MSFPNPYASGGSPPGPPAEQRAAVRPRTRWFGVGAALLAAGLVVGVLGIAVFVRAFSLHLDSFSTDQPTSSELVAGKTYDIYVETQEENPALVCTVDGPNGGLSVEREDWAPVFHDGVEYDGTFKFTAVATAVHQIECRSASGHLELGVGRRVTGQTFVRGVVAVGLGGLLGLAGAVVLIVTAVRRHGSKKRLATSGGPWSPSAGQPHWPQQSWPSPQPGAQAEPPPPWQSGSPPARPASEDPWASPPS